MNTTPLYTKTFDEAKAENEISLYKESKKATTESVSFIIETLKSNSEPAKYGQYVHVDKIIDDCIQEYSKERLNIVFAHEIFHYAEALTSNSRLIDGRYSKDNVNWAKTTLSAYSESEIENIIKSLEYCSIADKSHPTIVNSLITEYRKRIA